MKYYEDDKIEDGSIGWPCRMCGREEKCILNSSRKTLVGTPKRREVDNLIWILNKSYCEDVDRIKANETPTITENFGRRKWSI
jgi:hypothetical protein